MKRRRILLAVMLTGSLLLASTAMAQLPPGSLVIKVLAEKKVAALPAGKPRLYWRLENFTSLAQAQASAGPTGLAVESAGRAWLFTLVPRAGPQRAAPRWRRLDPSRR